MKRREEEASDDKNDIKRENRRELSWEKRKGKVLEPDQMLELEKVSIKKEGIPEEFVELTHSNAPTPIALDRQSRAERTHLLSQTVFSDQHRQTALLQGDVGA